MSFRLLLAVLFAWCSTLVMAQEIYQTRDKEGPVYSDHPISGANPIALPPINTYATPPVLVPAAPEKPQASASVVYERLAISDPENEGTIHSNTGDFDVQWQAVPPLDARRGDAVIVKLDGAPLPQSFTAMPLHIGPADWQQASSESVKHSLQLLIVNQDGAVLIESAPVSFYMHRATVHHNLK